MWGTFRLEWMLQHGWKAKDSFIITSFLKIQHTLRQYCTEVNSNTLEVQYDWWLPSLEAADRTAAPWCSGPAEGPGQQVVQVEVAGSWPPPLLGTASWWWAGMEAPGGSPSGCLTKDSKFVFLFLNLISYLLNLRSDYLIITTNIWMLSS